MDTDITLNIKQTMSIPSELYARTAADYDRTRGAVGLEIILGCFAVGGELHRAMLARHVDVPRLREMLSAAGFSHRAVIAPLDAVLQGDAYFNPRGPANAKWRSGDSIWSLLSAAETKAVEKRIAKLARQKALKKFMQDADAERKNCGQISFMFSVKARKSVTMSATQSIGKSTVTGGSP